jgi:ATP-dependent protease ClpP protease subunit
MPKKYLPVFNKATAEKPHEILVHGPIGRSFWSDDGITGLEFTDALNQVPAGEKVVVGVNSQGGYIGEGLAIFNAIARRSADITVRNDGYMLSIASFFPLAAGKVVCPDTSVWMMHKGWSGTEGNADDHRKSADMLDTHDNVLVGEYVKKTGKSETEIRAMLAAETWMTGKEAVAYGLADEASENETALDALDFSGIEAKAFKHVPQGCKSILAAASARNLKLSAPPQGAAKPQPQPPAKPGTAQENTMNKKILAALLLEHGVKTSDGKDFAETDTDANFEAGLKTLAKKSGLPADARFAAIEASLALAEDRRITDKVATFVTDGVITNEEAETVWIPAAKKDETKTLALLAKKEPALAGGSPLSWSGIDILDGNADPSARDGLTGLAGPRSEMLVNIHKEHKTPEARHRVIKAEYSALLRQALAKDAKTGRREVFAANTYSGTLVTNFLMDGSITDLTHVWAMFSAFSIAKDVDPYKPLAVGQLKHITGSEAAQTNPTNFEPTDGSTVAPISITTAWINQPCRVGPTDLNNGLRIEDLRVKSVASFADAVTQAATAPITASNFTATPVITSAAAFGLSDLATLQGQLQKSPTKNLILDGTYKARIANQPGFFQPTGTVGGGGDGWKPYGWDGIHLASNWAGAGANIKGFACAPQAIVRATGLPLNPPNIPGGVFTTSTFEIPGAGCACAISMWFSLATRTMFISWDIIAGFAAADKTAGVVIASGTPS